MARRPHSGTSAGKDGPAPGQDIDEMNVIVLQGGGALGAYQAGAAAALCESGFAPQWVAGISIGAINAAILCGNPPGQRLERLETFWRRITAALPAPEWVAGLIGRQSFCELASAAVLAGGVPGFFSPRLPLAAMVPGALWQMTSYYDTAPLHESLQDLVDFDYLNAEGPRLCVGAVEVGTGNFVYFDSSRQWVGPEHVMASGALPPGFPPVEIEGRWYWDGGLVSNTPLQYVMEHAQGARLCIFQMDLFSARGAIPRNLLEVQAREKDIRYSSRTRLTTDRYCQLNALSQAADRLYAKLPPEWRDDPDLAFLRDSTPDHSISLVHLIHRKENFESATKDYEFSRLTMRQHWRAGETDVRRTLGHRRWKNREIGTPGLQIFDLASEHS